MTALELILILSAAALLWAQLMFREKRPLLNLLLVLSLVPALFLAVEGTTELLTTDETYMITELTDFNELSARQWELGNYRTSIAVIGTAVNGARGLSSLDDLRATELAKGVHWLLGIITLAGIFSVISHHWISKDRFGAYFLIYFYSALLLPTNILALKAANYDMLAMFLGIWGIICSLAGLEQVKPRFLRTEKGAGRSHWRSIFAEALWPDGGLSLVGLVLTTLAAQEKQIASPLLSLAILLATLMRLRRRGGFDWWFPIQLGLSIGIVLFVLALTHGVVALWHPPDLPAFDLSPVLASLLFHFNAVARALGFAGLALPALSGFALATIASAAALIWFLRQATEKIARATVFAFPALLVAAIATGVFAFYRVKAYVHPFFPIPAGNFVPGDEMSDAVIHFLKHDRLQHLLTKLAHTYAIFGSALPTVFAIIALLALVLLIRNRSPFSRSLLGFHLLGIVSVLMPALYVITNTPVGPRYFDIWLFVPVLLLGILTVRLVKTPIQRSSPLILLAGGLALSLIFEVLPFRPIVGAFWPWWANAARLQGAQVPEIGKLLPIWHGWGEETMLAGQWLRSMARAGRLPSDSFHLISLYRGSWLQPSKSIDVRWAGDISYRDLSFTENDYYVVRRECVVQNQFRFAPDKQPLWVLRYRGVPMAWLFRGADVKDLYYAGCPFVLIRGKMWMFDGDLPGNQPEDTVENPTASTVVMYENNVPLGPIHSEFEAIEEMGGGRSSHRRKRFYFSTSDNSNPNTNGRDYRLRAR